MNSANGKLVEMEAVPEAPETDSKPVVPAFKMFHRVVDWITNDRMQLINVTDRINDIVRKSGVRDGVVPPRPPRWRHRRSAGRSPEYAETSKACGSSR